MAKLESKYGKPEESPGFLLWQVTNSWQRKLRSVLKEVNLTHVQFVLLTVCSWLNSLNKQVTQSSLAQAANVDVMMTSQVVRTLEKKNLIVRKRHPTDTRANLLEVTPIGEELSQKALQLVEKADMEFFSLLDEAAVFARLLKKLL